MCVKPWRTDAGETARCVKADAVNSTHWGQTLIHICSGHTHLFTDKIDNIRNTITNVDSTASSTSASFIAPKEKLNCFTTIGQDELNKLITTSKPTTCLLDPVPTKLLKELLPVAEEPLLNIINSSLSLGHVPKPFKLAVIKPLIKKPKLDPCELANYRLVLSRYWNF